MNKNLTRLLHSVGAGRVHHAYIFSGPEGRVKEDVATLFASVLIHFPTLSPVELSTLTFLHAPEFKAIQDKVARRIHPDFSWIEPEDKILKVDDVRELPRTLAYSPLEGERRVVVIHRAERMNAAAANSILKILEEPPPYVVFLLLCQDTELLLPTLRSRSQVIPFPALGTEEIQRLLKRKFPEANPKDLDSAVAWADGAPERAEKFLGDANYRRIVEESGEALLKVWEENPRAEAEALRFVENLKGADEARIVLASWFGLARDLAVAEELKRHKVRLGVLPDVQTKIDFRHPLAGERFGRALAHLPAAFFQKLPAKVHAIDGAGQDLEFHVNPKTLLVGLLAELDR